jgi:hypothetical protein
MFKPFLLRKSWRYGRVVSKVVRALIGLSAVRTEIRRRQLT